MSEWTKAPIKKTLLEKVKVKATAENRSVANYIETLILKDLKSGGLE